MRNPEARRNMISGLAILAMAGGACAPSVAQPGINPSATPEPARTQPTESIFETPASTSTPTFTPEPTFTPTLEPTPTLAVLAPAYPDWAKAAVTKERGEIIELTDGQVVVIRSLRKGEDPNTPAETRIMLVLNHESDEWQVPLPSIKESYAKYVNPFKTKTFATKELSEYEPELFDIPSLDPIYLQYWLSQFSQTIIDNGEGEVGYIDRRYSECYPVEESLFGLASECRLGINPVKPLFLKHQDYLIYAIKTGMPKESNYWADYFSGVIYFAADVQTLSKTTREIFPEGNGWLHGVESFLVAVSGFVDHMYIHIGPKLNDPNYPGEMLFRSIMDVTHPDLAEKLFTFIDTKGENISDKEREELMGWMSETIFPGYPLWIYLDLATNKTDWRENFSQP